MKRPPDYLIQIIILIVTAAAAITITVIALVTVKPEDRFKTPVLVTYSPAAQPARSTTPNQPIIPYISRTPAINMVTLVPRTAIPTMFSTSLPDNTMVPPLQRTNIPIFVATSRYSTQLAMLTEYVKATQISAEQTKMAGAPCQCFADLYDCSTFYTHTAAQLCMNYCIRLGFGDIHKLDDDKDGFACESR